MKEEKTQYQFRGELFEKRTVPKEEHLIVNFACVQKVGKGSLNLMMDPLSTLMIRNSVSLNYYSS